jgi:hypothetical protein
MTNDEWQMTKESPMTNDETFQPRLLGHSGFGIDASFVIDRLFLSITNGEEPKSCHCKRTRNLGQNARWLRFVP